MNTLVVTSILPMPYIDHKKNENNILFITEDNISLLDKGISFTYIYTVPYSNLFLSLLSRKWRQYFILKKKRIVKSDGRNVHILPVFQLPIRTFLDPLLFSLSFYLNKSRLRSIIVNNGINVTHSHNSVVDGFIGRKILKHFKISFLITDRGLKDGRSIPRFVKKNWDSASHIISLNRIGQSKLPEVYLKKASIIPHGIDRNYYIDNSFIESKFDKVPSNTAERIKLVSVGRLVRGKNFDTLIKAMPKLENFELDIYGDGSEEIYNELSQLIINLHLQDRVRLLGFLENEVLLGCLSRYDIFVLLSFKESFGRVYLEAMARGLMIVCSKGTGFDGIVKDESEGFVIDPEDIDSYISRMRQLEIDGASKIKELSIHAFKKATEFRWETIASKIYALYSEIANKKN